MGSDDSHSLGARAPGPIRRRGSRRRCGAALLAGILLLGLDGLPLLHEIGHDARTHVHDGDVVRFEDVTEAALDHDAWHDHGGSEAELHEHRLEHDGDEERALPEGSSGLDHPEPWHRRHGAHSALHGNLAVLAPGGVAAPEPVEPLRERPPPLHVGPLAILLFRIPVVAQGPPSA
jgi:hypothetical protein